MTTSAATRSGPTLETPQAGAGTLSAYAYLSLPVRPFSRADLDGLLRSARAANEAHGVTGKLFALRVAGETAMFVQWVEGERSGLEVVTGRILGDERHRILEVLYDGPVAARQFSDWQMCFAVDHVETLRHIGLDLLLTGVP